MIGAAAHQPGAFRREPSEPRERDGARQPVRCDGVAADGGGIHRTTQPQPQPG
ncbi:hypothetical protein NX868_28475 [Burkholderia thailandensis]|nr:hypothetical protein [Burkholderia thailandensis]MCS3395226.1 hypothetical protein [Burkholderia thailandensis]MCS6428762.1 hypothetical protein [Burkholderia thailandensis]MCS6456579.1 hypothetical protein [Burkholderia thailandensis]MCS6467776.1 hypothetical protein [Burkholderia thailandensis]MCS6486200.1 hypothetical protein [Burkholderia thailandensis]